VKGETIVKKSSQIEPSPKVHPGQGRFASYLKTGMHDHGYPNAAQLAAKIGVTREHVRKLLANEAQPSKPLTMAIAKLLDLNEDTLWAVAQEDRLERKFGHSLLAKSRGKNPRIAQFEPYLLALTEEQVPAALAMLKGLTSSQKTRKALTMHFSSLPLSKVKQA
jgi:transcriptional regulator with XRE-family HTH domain